MPHRHSPIIFILLAFLFMAGLYSVVNPLFEAPDEVWHYEYVRWLVEENGLPRPEDVGVAPWNQEGSQPPLYYLATALLTSPIPTGNAAEVIRYNPHAAIGQGDAPGNKNMIAHGPADGWPWRGVALSAHVARLFSLLLGALTILFTYMAARTIFPARPAISLTAAALIAFNPQFLFISAAVSNDNMVTAVSAAAILLAVTALGLRDENGRQARPGWGLLALMGLVAGLGALSKLSGLLIIPLMALSLTLVAWRRRSLGEWVQYGLVVGGLTLAIAGWWYLRNWLLFADPLALSAMFDVLPGRTEPPALDELLALAQGVWRSYWAVFGWFNVVVDEWNYAFYGLLTLAGLGGLLVGLPLQRLYCRRDNDTDEVSFQKSGDAESRKRQRRGPQRFFEDSYDAVSQDIERIPGEECLASLRVDPWQITLLILWVMGVTLLLARWAQISHPQGRLLFPAISAASILIAYGLNNWLPRRFQRWMPPALGVFMIPLALWLPFRYIAPAYAAPTPPAVNEISTEVDFGDLMRLSGYELGAVELNPGDALPVILEWQPLQSLDRDYSIFIHLTDENEILQAQRDSFPGRGHRPTGDWAPGEVIVDPHEILVPETAPAPARLRVDVGVYDYSSGERLLVDGIDHWTLGYVTLLPSVEGDLPNSVFVNFDDEIALVGYEFDRRRMKPGETLALTLWWEALAKPAQDYAIFTHLVLPPEAVWAQKDGQPQHGEAPTSSWEVGQRIEDRYELTLPEEAPPGVYFVEIGIYDRETFSRLRVNFSDKGVVLGQVRVEEE